MKFCNSYIPVVVEGERARKTGSSCDNVHCDATQRAYVRSVSKRYISLAINTDVWMNTANQEHYDLYILYSKPLITAKML